MKVFAHVKDSPSSKLRNIGLEFSQVPSVGEHFVLDSSSEWYEVKLVVHVPSGEQYAAEIYAVLVDHHHLVTAFTGNGEIYQGIWE